MNKNYEINQSTLALIPENKYITKIIELDQEIYIQSPSIKLVDESCRSFGSSLNGRHDGTKKIIGINYKAPIIISESTNIIFFPTTSPREEKCIWLSLNNIKKYYKENNKTIIQFHNQQKLELDISYYILENQILKASMLEAKLLKMKLK